MSKTGSESETASKQYFERLGFAIRDRDFEGRKKGADFFIELDGCIQSVEAKTKMGTRVIETPVRPNKKRWFAFDSGQ